MKKKVLIIGNGANAYALAKKLSEKHEVFSAPESDTLKEFAQCADIRENNSAELLEYAMENGIDMTVPISDTALKSDITELFTKNNLPIFAPNFNSAKIVFDKASAKKTLYRLRVPTPKFGIFEKQNMALDYIKNQKPPFVIKTGEADSAVVLTSFQVAKNIIEDIFTKKISPVIIEDYVYGTPFAFYAVTDGYKALPLGSSVTYKHSLEGEGGQLTSGMGSCSPNYKLSLEHEYFLMDNVIYPTLDLMEIEGNPYTGILGVNGIITAEGELAVLGYKTFMQDCDAMGVLECLDEDIFEIFDSCIIGSFSDEKENIKFKDLYAVSVVVKSANKTNNNNVITGLDMADEDLKITFYPSVKKNKYLEYEAAKGSVLALTASAGTVTRASKKVYSALEEINFSGMTYRKDIENPKDI